MAYRCAMAFLAPRSAPRETVERRAAEEPRRSRLAPGVGVTARSGCSPSSKLNRRLGDRPPRGRERHERGVRDCHSPPPAPEDPRSYSLSIRRTLSRNGQTSCWPRGSREAGPPWPVPPRLGARWHRGSALARRNAAGYRPRQARRDPARRSGIGRHRKMVDIGRRCRSGRASARSTDLLRWLRHGVLRDRHDPLVRGRPSFAIR